MTLHCNNLKYRIGYIIPSSRREDAVGIDFWIKMPRDDELIPIQITQRGTRVYQIFHNIPETRLQAFMQESEEKTLQKQIRSIENNIAFVLIRDYDGSVTNPNIAWGDIKALRYGVAHLKRRL